MNRYLNRIASVAVLTGVAFLWSCDPEAQQIVGPDTDPVTNPAPDSDLFAGSGFGGNMVKGANFTTFNEHVDGGGKDVCKNSAINCNIYGAKEYVWLNGGPAANGLGPDGDYFFAVLEPGGQPNPNDQGAVTDKNLSDDYDCYLNRTFTITNGEVAAYTGNASCPAPYTTFTDPHWLDSGERESNPDVKPNGLPPFIRLFPYSDTRNPGGVYILAICSLDESYPVQPADCKYDAFKVREGRMDVSFFLSGIKYADLDTNGDFDNEPLLPGWTITIDGTGPDGLPIDAEVTTDANGFWFWNSDPYTFNGQSQPQPVTLKICEVLQEGWTQSEPGGDGCHYVEFSPTGFDEFMFLDFGNFREDLTVTKTVVTSFQREHFWDIAKRVDTENGYTELGDPKIWLFVDDRSYDETATWTVDVTYEGYTDSEHNVSGDITITNASGIGKVDAVINSVVDELAGTAITVTCPVTFPYTLTVGSTLTCTYDEDGYVTGNNVATVTTERDTYSDTKPIVWGAPNPEINKTVNVQDISDLFPTQNFGPLTAPTGGSFTYDKAFTWADPYSADNCGDFVYDNTATIVETEQSADATLRVNVQCYVYESAWAEGSGAGVTAEPFCDTFSNWGWTNQIGPGTYTGWTLWAGAGQCDPSKGLDVGTVDVVYDGDGYVEVTYNVDFPYIITERHVYVDVYKYPNNASGPTTAPGQYYNASPFAGVPVWVIAHAVVGIPDPAFGPPSP